MSCNEQKKTPAPPRSCASHPSTKSVSQQTVLSDLGTSLTRLSMVSLSCFVTFCIRSVIFEKKKWWSGRKWLRTFFKTSDKRYGLRRKQKSPCRSLRACVQGSVAAVVYKTCSQTGTASRFVRWCAPGVWHPPTLFGVAYHRHCLAHVALF